MPKMIVSLTLKEVKALIQKTYCDELVGVPIKIVNNSITVYDNCDLSITDGYGATELTDDHYIFSFEVERLDI